MDVNVQKQCVKVFTTEGVINMQPLLVLTQDMTGVAQEDTLVQGISDIRGDIANIDIDTSTLAKEQTLTDGIGAIRGDIANISIDTSTLAQRTDVKDGNDTAISVSKEIRSEVGTGSDTAAETGTLFAILKWVKDKVKSIFNLIGSPASGQPSTLFAAIAAGGGGGGEFYEYPVVNMSSTTATLDPNKLYMWDEVASLDITLASPSDPTIVNEYMFMFRSGSSGTSIVFNDSNIIVRGIIPLNSIVCVSVLNNVALIV